MFSYRGFKTSFKVIYTYNYILESLIPRLNHVAIGGEGFTIFAHTSPPISSQDWPIFINQKLKCSPTGPETFV